MDAPHLTDAPRASSESLLLPLCASVSPLNAGVVTTWGKEEAGPLWGVEPVLSLPLGPLPKPIQCPAALQEAQKLCWGSGSWFEVVHAGVDGLCWG